MDERPMVCAPHLPGGHRAGMGSAGHCAETNALEGAAGSSVDMDRGVGLPWTELFPGGLSVCARAMKGGAVDGSTELVQNL